MHGEAHGVAGGGLGDTGQLDNTVIKAPISGTILERNVEKGEFVFLVGPSGSGKSTFLRLVLKEERPTNGHIRVAGRDLARLSNWRVPMLRRRIGCVFQDFRLLPAKSVYQNIAFALEVIGKPRRFIRKVVPEVIDLVGLEGKGERMPDELSGGEQQRVAVARAFVNRPRLTGFDRSGKSPP